MPVSSELIERVHYKRRSSFIQEQRGRQMLGTLQEIDIDIVDKKTNTHPSQRRKAASVSVSMTSMSPEIPLTSNEFRAQRYGGTPRFLVERNSQPLNIEELQSVRLRGVSSSEVFHEPPKMYVYRERPLISTSKPSGKNSLMDFINERKHTICAWTFGIFAVAMLTTIIILQTIGELS